MELIRCTQTVFEELVQLVDPGESAPPAFNVRSFHLRSSMELMEVPPCSRKRARRTSS